MQKAEAQHSQIQSHPVQRQGGGMALASPQGELITQLEAMAEASLQVAKLAQLTTMANNNPRMAAQRKVISAIHNSSNMTAQRQQLDSLTREAAQREKIEEPLQPKVTQRKAAPAKPNASTQLSTGNTGLPDNLKSGIKSLSGLSIDNEKVHYNSSQPAQLNALAYTQGTDIHVAPGQKQHLPHEAWHVVQQAQGRVKPTMQPKGTPINDDQGLEHEADVMGAKAVSVGTVQAKQSIESAPIDATPVSVVQKLTIAYDTPAHDTVITWVKGSSKAETKVKESDGVTAEVKPSDYDTGSVTTAGVRPISQAATAAFDVSFIAGHMLNKHLGGPGNDQKNITAITSKQNSQHHSGLERAAKAAVKGGETITYKTKIIERATFSLGTSTAVNLASKLHGEFNGDKGSKGALDIDLGPPNAKKTGGTARDEEKVNQSQEYLLMNTNAVMEFWEDEKKIKAGIDSDELREWVSNKFSGGNTAERIYGDAKKAGYVS